jgi:hypothetical protein
VEQAILVALTERRSDGDEIPKTESVIRFFPKRSSSELRFSFLCATNSEAAFTPKPAFFRRQNRIPGILAAC